MSFGALSREAKLALATGQRRPGTAMCSGEGGILPESSGGRPPLHLRVRAQPYSVTDENLQRVDAIEIKIGQSAKPGMGGHLPATRSPRRSPRSAASPRARTSSVPRTSPTSARRRAARRRSTGCARSSGGKPIGIKLAAGHIEADLEVALARGRRTSSPSTAAPGAHRRRARSSSRTPTSVPTIFALHRARAVPRRERGRRRLAGHHRRACASPPTSPRRWPWAPTPSPSARPRMIAVGCQQYRICNTGSCPVGIATQDPELRARLDVDQSAAAGRELPPRRTEELKDFARLTGHDDVHGSAWRTCARRARRSPRYTRHRPRGRVNDIRGIPCPRPKKT